jgi:excisionase family DNA binding protein
MEYYTVEQISEMLSIHPKTIQRYIREGKLRASKIGKSWRVTGHDLSMFTENARNTGILSGTSMALPDEDRVKISSVIDICVYDRDEAIRIMNTMTAVTNSKPPEYGSSSMHTQYIEAENKVRVTLWGTLRFMEAMIGSISALTEQTN